MSFKLIIFCATLAMVSCARLENDQLMQQMQQQQEVVEQHNERIRDQQQIESQQRQVQIQDLEDQRRRQEQMIRDQQQQRLDIIRSNENRFVTVQRQFSPVYFVAVPTTRHNFEYIDGSNYNFAYAVSDLTTGDMKSQQEVRHGDQVQGQYTIMDADGYQRIVDYRADDQNGFDAEVRREPAVIAPQVVRIDGRNSFVPQHYHQQLVSAQQPAIYSSTSVSRRDDGQRSQYTSTTASNF